MVDDAICAAEQPARLVITRFEGSEISFTVRLVTPA